MNNNPLIGLRKLGQSVWLDNLSRKLINSGELKRFIDEDGLSGVTSNPTIFQKAISGSTDYETSLQRMINKGIKDEKEKTYSSKSRPRNKDFLRLSNSPAKG